MRVECDICDGSGVVEYELRGAQYYRGDELEPRYENGDCHACGGSGEIVVCPVCKQVEDDCPCSEDDFVELGRSDYAEVFA